MLKDSYEEVEFPKTKQELEDKAEKWLRIKGSQTEVYVRLDGYRAVALFFDGTRPHPGTGRGGYHAVKYIPAQTYLHSDIPRNCSPRTSRKKVLV